MNRKTLSGFEIKDAAKGQISAVFATFNVVDRDRDVTLPGAFTDGAEAVISDYGHSAMDGAAPVGKATIRQTKTEAIFDGQYFMDTAAGRDAFATVKQLGALNQFSYGYTAKDYRFGEFQDQRVRFLVRQEVHEVSPVVQGAGINTRLLSAKSGHNDGGILMELKGAIRPHVTDVLNEAWDAAAALEALGAKASVSDLRAIAAWADPTGDPEVKGSYRFVHHAKSGGPANVRACYAGISTLNLGLVEMGDEDRQTVYDHLAAHIRDADREPPALRAKGAGAGGSDVDTITDRIFGGLVATERLIADVGGLVATADGSTRKLSRVKAEYLGWMHQGLKAATEQLRAYLDTPDDIAAAMELERLRLIRSELTGGHNGIVPGSEGGPGEARREA